MAINANDTFSLDLSLFGGKVSDMAPGNLPAGTSPYCSDVFFGAQYVATRPAFIQVFQAALGTGDILSVKDYPASTGQTNTISLYSDGSLWSSNVQTGVSTQLGSVAADARFNSIAAFDKFFMAFRNLSLTSPFAQLAGGDVPRYINSFGHMWRLTSDAPGGGLAVTNLTIGPEDLVTPSAFVLGPAITSINYDNAKSIIVGGAETVVYNNAVVVLASSVSLVPGQIVQMYDIIWDIPGGPQWPGGVAVQEVLSGTSFTVAIPQTGNANIATGGSFAYGSSLTLTRENNTVTAYLAGTSPSAPTIIQAGWFVVLSDTQPTGESPDAPPATVPDGTAPFVGDELFQAIFPTATGGPTVGLLTGTTVLVNGYPEANPTEPGGEYFWTYPGDGQNVPYIPSTYNGNPNSSTYELADDQTLFFNMPSGGFVPGFSFVNESTQSVQVPNLNADGTYTGHSISLQTAQYFHGEGNNFDMSAYGTFVVSVAGNVTFTMNHRDGFLLGIEGATYVSGPLNNPINPPQTVSAIKGYTLMAYNNTAGNAVDTIVVNFPAPGNYAFELDMRHFADSVGWWDLCYNNGTTNLAILPTKGVGSSNVVGDGIGNIHVTLPTAVNNLAIGSYLYLFLYPNTPAAVTAWILSAGGFGIITVPGVNWEVGTTIQLNGFVQGGPTSWNGLIVVISAADPNTNDYEFVYASNSSGGGVISGGQGTATPVGATYPSGWVQVTQVPSNTEFVYYALGNTSTTGANGLVYDYFGSLNSNQALVANTASIGQATINQVQAASSTGIVQGFQVLSVDTSTTPNSITWYQSGFDDTYTGTHILQVQPNSQVAGGPRSAVVFFINEDEGATPASYPLLLQLNGGTQYPSVQLPIGPPGTVARGVGFTPAYGADYYVLGASTQPLTASGAPVINLGTIVKDNSTTQLIMDFSDVALVNGIFIGPGPEATGEDFGDLTSTIVLPPCLGVIEYDQALIWWGELNCLPNHSMVNMGFDGGYTPVGITGPVGPYPAGTGTSVPINSYNVAWKNPQNVAGSSYASAVTGATAAHQPFPKTTQQLFATNFNFSLAATASIGGITVALNSYYTSLGLGVPNGLVSAQLTYAGAPVGTAKTFVPTISATTAPPGSVGQTLGGSSDLWGTSLTTANLDSTAFGVIFTFSDVSNTHNDTVFIGNVQMTLSSTGSIVGAKPLGWNSTTEYNGIVPDGTGSLVLSPNGLGFAYQMPCQPIGFSSLADQIVVTGNITSGTFQDGETVIQSATGITAVTHLVGGYIPGSSVPGDGIYQGPLVVSGLSGSADATHTWVGQTSGAIFTPNDFPTGAYYSSLSNNHVNSGFVSVIEFNMILQTTTSGNQNWFVIQFGNDSTGHGPALVIQSNVGANACGFALATSWIPFIAPALGITNPTISHDDWHSYKITLDGAGNASWYIDGVLQSTANVGVSTQGPYCGVYSIYGNQWISGQVVNGLISQPFWQDFYGKPIGLPNRSYLMRFQGCVVSGTPSGNLTFNIYSPSIGMLATATVPLASWTSTMSWYTAFFNSAMPVSIPQDAVFYLTFDGSSVSNFVIDLDELEIIDAQQPVLKNQLRVSYPDNEFGYDNENGFVIGLDTTDFIASCFLQRSYLYVNTENDLHVVKNNGEAPSEWDTSLFAAECGSSGPDCVATGQSIAWWMGRQGAQVFEGQQPHKISMPITQDFDLTNWDAAVNSCVAHDAVQRVNYFSFPTGSSINPNFVHCEFSRMSDESSRITPDPVHVSPYTGKIISTDLSMKWTPMMRPVNAMTMSTQKTPHGVTKVMVFALAGYGQLYTQDMANYAPVTGNFSSWNCSDADFLNIGSYYQTYFMYAHDTEQQPMLALYRKIFAYLSAHVVGVGQFTITPYVDALNQPWAALYPWPLSLTDPGIDYDLGASVVGNRMSLLFTVGPNTGDATESAGFLLTHLIVSARKDNVFPVRGCF